MTGGFAMTEGLNEDGGNARVAEPAWPSRGLIQPTVVLDEGSAVSDYGRMPWKCAGQAPGNEYGSAIGHPMWKSSLPIHGGRYVVRSTAGNSQVTGRTGDKIAGATWQVAPAVFAAGTF
jgi:hypothetical protein